jgi:hypothetical protein
MLSLSLDLCLVCFIYDILYVCDRVCVNVVVTVRPCFCSFISIKAYKVVLKDLFV